MSGFANRDPLFFLITTHVLVLAPRVCVRIRDQYQVATLGVAPIRSRACARSLYPWRGYGGLLPQGLGEILERLIGWGEGGR